MSENIEFVRGDSLSFVVALQVDGSPINWATWSPVAQIRPSEDSASVAAFTVSTSGLPAGSARFTLSAAVTAEMSGSYVWDVEFIDPSAASGAGVVTWPGFGARHTLTLAKDTSRRTA